MGGGEGSMPAGSSNCLAALGWMLAELWRLLAPSGGGDMVMEFWGEYDPCPRSLCEYEDSRFSQAGRRDWG